MIERTGLWERVGGIIFGLSFVFVLGPPQPAAAAEDGDFVGVLRLENPAGRIELRRAIERGLKFLAGRQEPSSGSVGSRYQVAVTSLAGLSFLGAGYGYDRGTYGPCVRRCVDYLVQTARTSWHPGFVARAREDHAMHGHGYAILFLTQVYGELPLRRQRDVKGVIRRGIDVIASAKSWRGGWYYHPANEGHRDENSVTVCVLQALRAARNVGFVVRPDLITGAQKYLEDCHKSDGSFRYSISRGASYSTFELTAGAVASLQALGRYGGAEVKSGIAYMQRRLNGVGSRPLDAARHYPFYGNFYAAQAFYLAGEATWNTWYPRALKQLIARGTRNGGTWTSRFGEEYATAMAVLILEVPLGYLPIFQK